MKIAIDYRLASTSNRGMARYCREVVNELFSIDKENEYILLTNTIPNDLELPQNFNFYIIKNTNYILAEQISLPIAINRLKPDILWCPYNTFPVLLSKRIKLVVTIHDLIFFHKQTGKASLYKNIGRYYRQFILKYFNKKINICFTVSKFSKNEIIRILNWNKSIFVTYNCLSNDFINKCKLFENETKDDFYFTVSGDSPSKNLMFLINFFNKNIDKKLVIAGLGKNSPFRKFQSSNIQILPAGITDEELIKNYSTCKAFIFPSLDEGFGIPLIEALACKSKILSSNSSCLPEIVGNNGILFDPLSEKSFEDALEKLNTHIFSYNIEEYKSWKKTAEIIYTEIIKK